MANLTVTDQFASSGIGLILDSIHIPLPSPHTAGPIITNTLLHIRSGIAPARIIEHITYHQSTTTIDPHCPCCKLEGRIMAASGRKRPDTSIAQRAVHGGTVQVRHIKPGLSGAQLRAYEEAYFKREARPKKAAPLHPEPVKFVAQSIEELI